MLTKQKLLVRKKTIGAAAVLLGLWVAGVAGQNVTLAETNATVTAANYSSSILERYSEVTTPTQGNVMVALEGTFERPDKQAIIKRLNEIRLEAYNLGLVDSYVPTQWSDAIEKAAMTRAAEAAVTFNHIRLSDKSLSTAQDSVSYGGENLAWNYESEGNAILKAIEQWYGEKEEYIKTRKWSGSTGHYIAMIKPANAYTAVAGFGGNYLYPFSVAQWFGSTDAAPTNSTPEHYGKTIQLTEATASKLLNPTVEDKDRVMNVGTLSPVDMGVRYYEAETQKYVSFKVKEGFTFTSSNPSVATVVNGSIKALSPGKTTITVTLNGQSIDIAVSVVDASRTNLSTLTTSEYKEVAYKTVKKGDYNLEKGIRKTVTYGKNGRSKFTTTYSLDANGQIVKNVAEEVISPVVNEEIHVGIKSEVNYQTPVSVQYIADDTMNFGESLESNHVTVNATVTYYYYDDDKDEVVSAGSYPRSEYVASQVRVGTRPTTTFEETPYKTIYQADPTLEANRWKEITSGQNGKKTVTTTYKLDGDHAVIDKVTPVEIPLVNQVIAVGTKAEVETVELPYDRTYVADYTLNAGERKVITAGVKGVDTTTTTYKLVGNTAVVDQKSTSRTTNPVTEVVKVGTKDSEEYIDVNYWTEERMDATLTVGTRKVIQAGKKGQIKRVTPYQLDTYSGELMSTSSYETVITEATPEIVVVGTKPAAKVGFDGDYYYDESGNQVFGKWVFDQQYNSWFYIKSDGKYARNEWVGDYYLKNGGYMAKSEWVYDNSYQSWFYLRNDGSYARNEWVGDYYLKNGGYMAKSEWIYDSSYQSWYYLHSNGIYARNEWLNDNGTWYFFHADGKMAKGWLMNHGTWYFLEDSGAMKANKWFSVNGKWYYVNGSGALLVNTVTPDGYRVNHNGEWV